MTPELLVNLAMAAREILVKGIKLHLELELEISKPEAASGKTTTTPDTGVHP